MLEKERKYYKENLPRLLAESKGRIVLIHDEEQIGIYNTFDEALAEGAKRFGLSPFLVRRIEEKEEEITIPALSLGILRANSTSPA